MAFTITAWSLCMSLLVVQRVRTVLRDRAETTRVVELKRWNRVLR